MSIVEVWMTTNNMELTDMSLVGNLQSYAN
jgi:hypothetical protein